MNDKIKFIPKIHVSVYRTSLQLQIDDYINNNIHKLYNYTNSFSLIIVVINYNNKISKKNIKASNKTRLIIKYRVKMKFE